MKGIWLIAFSGFVFSKSLLAQEAEDTSVFKGFELLASKQNSSNIGAVRFNLPIAGSNSLADVLSRNSALFVKYYSPTSLATTSMRGMGAQHTAILWNGLNLQSSMNGVLDMNLLPSFFIDKAAVETGANASSSANGAIAGAIYLNNRIERKKTVFTEVQRGSFNYESYALGWSSFVNKWSFRTRALYKETDNNYSYKNYFKPGKPLEKLEFSKFRQYGFMQEAGFAANKKNTFYLNAWHQQTNRQLPPPMGAVSLHERQDDLSTKILLQHDMKLNTNVAMVNKVAYLDEQINYFNDALAPAYSHARIGIAESELKAGLLKNLILSASVNYTYQSAVTDGYLDGKQRNLVSLWTRLDWKGKYEKLRLSLANRQLMVNGRMMPSSPDFAFEYEPLRGVIVKGNAAYSFRIPSFNDLYWSQGGNTGLQPERGKKAELSTELRKGNFKLSATLFYHLLNNWIMWLPDPQTNIWRATNARQVESKGIEIASEYAYAFLKHYSVKLYGRYQYVRSINTKVYAEDMASLDKQLFYTPVHCGFAQFNYKFRAFQLNLGATYTGMRFTTSDNNPVYTLPAYTLFHATLAYHFVMKGQEASLQFQCNNLGNTNYQVIENRPMPSRNYQINLKININYEKN